MHGTTYWTWKIYKRSNLETKNVTSSSCSYQLQIDSQEGARCSSGPQAGSSSCLDFVQITPDTVSLCIYWPCRVIKTTFYSFFPVFWFSPSLQIFLCVCSQSSGGEVDKDVLFITREMASQVQALVTFRHDPDSVHVSLCLFFFSM